MKTIFTALSPNVESDDINKAWDVLFAPKKWYDNQAVLALEDFVKNLFQVETATAFVTGRSALAAILSSLNLSQDDEVLLQAFTCVAVPDPVLWNDLKPVYVDVEEDYNMSAADLEKKITPKSKVLIIQHTFGLPAKLDQLLAVARKHNLFVIEDCAHALGAKYDGKYVGTFGDAAFFSFGRDKVVSSVFGGMAITNNQELAEKIQEEQKKKTAAPQSWILQQLIHPFVTDSARLNYDKGIGKWLLAAARKIGILSKPVQPQEKVGEKPLHYSYRFPGALATLALHQIKKLEKFNKHRQEIARIYSECLNLPFDNSSIYLRFSLSTDKRDQIMSKAKQEKIFLGNWYDFPVSPSGVDMDKIMYRHDCPTSEKLAKTTLNLPTDIHISADDAKRICDLVKSV